MNSKPLSNTDVYESYKQRFGHCSEFLYWGWISIVDDKAIECSPFIETRGDLVRHHLWSIGRRPDFRSNLLICRDYEHDWMHKHPQEGRVIAVLAKLRKREKIGEPEEFDWLEMTLASGKNIIGVIEGYRFADERFQRLQQVVVARLQEIEGSVKCGR